MENRNIITIQDFELDKELIFEKQVITRVTFRKRDVIDQLMGRIRNLESEVKRLNKKESLPSSPVLLTQESLKEIWDNEKDDVWTNF